MLRTYYLESDIAWLLKRFPYLQVGRPSFIERMARAGNTYASTLALYPDVLCEPLEMHYLSLRGIAALDEFLLEDLLLRLDWRAAACGAWLAALSPRKACRPLLLAALAQWPHQADVIQLALDSLGNEPALRDTSSLRLRDIRRSLEPLRKPHIPLRQAPTEEQLRVMHNERLRLIEKYRTGGSEALLANLPGTLLGRFEESYENWRMTQAD